MELNQDELISIVIPFYNEELYFEECIESVLKQTYSNFEIIIVNDGSDKIFDTKLNDLHLRYPKIVQVYNKINEGVSSARNLGIQKANGKYIAFVDSDDMWFSNKLQHQMNLVKKYNLDFIHGSYLIIDENENFRGKFISKTLNYNQLINSCDIGLSTVLVKTTLMKKHLFKKITTKEDYICWLDIVKDIYELHGDEKVISYYRKKKNSLSSNVYLKIINAFKVYYKYEKKNFIVSLFYTLNLSINWVLKNNKIIYVYPEKIEFTYVTNFSNLKFQNSFILSALNLASLSNINLLYLNHKNIIFWIDGYFGKIIIDKDINRTPGRNIISKIEIPDNINKIYLCGNKSDHQIKFLENRYKKKIIFIKVPYFKELSKIKNLNIQIENNSLVIINVATPKQEILAINILKKNPQKKIYIFCIGGGLAMLTGEEKIVPKRLENLNLEWFWRLQTNTIFRLKRLTFSIIIFIFKKITNLYSKIKFKNLS